MTVAPEHDLLAIGQLASHVGRTVRAIEQAAQELKIQPAMKLNNVAYFDATQVERLTARLSEGGKQCST